MMMMLMRMTMKGGYDLYIAHKNYILHIMDFSPGAVDLVYLAS